MSFVLRQYCPVKKTNTVVGAFSGDKLTCKLHHTQADAVYQIYPGEANKTFYDLKPNELEVSKVAFRSAKGKAAP